MTTELTDCTEPHDPEYLCAECATDDELLAALGYRAEDYTTEEQP